MTATLLLPGYLTILEVLYVIWGVCLYGANSLLNLLQQYCVGNASKLISGCSSIDPHEGYLDALDTLERRCGNPHSIPDKLITSLRSGKFLKTAQDLLSLSDSLRDAYTILYELHEVIIPSSQKDCLRFLWFSENNDVSTFRMTGHVFGGEWCAASSTYALRRTVLDDSQIRIKPNIKTLNPYF
ncbi:hypothetical protein LOTGIDRAFT_157204 [Lottia gigantea]|uniref:Uncharacterized protein n=1 Tax=Lottia gigantea TaxID=225164 RepID=V4AWZ9_LOTGI|nr:hypothetical protein LOTGIDRAFT_157204 [Lottia gigantea]ESP02063.1 hypothetical protein LOTGIDRAFT_157204 [Lottia gigantea]